MIDAHPAKAATPGPSDPRLLDHPFGFGCNAFDAVPYANGEATAAGADAAEARMRRWLALFNTGTLPFYWARFEPERGRPDTERLRTAAAWLVERGVRVKGHPLCWHTLAPDWLLELSDAEIIAAQLDRIEREVGGFAGLIDTWDVVNEAVIMPVFDRYDNGITRMCRRLGQVETVRRTFEAARAANPGATLLLNDFDLSPAYEELIARCLDAGAPIDALGLQTHMHQGFWGEERLLETVERFARFGLPLHFTEVTLVSGDLMPAHIVDLNDWQPEDWPTTPEGEARQADEVVRFYGALVGHPAIASITWWDFADGEWLNAPSGMVRRDGSPKPAYGALHRLVHGD